jgi:molybdenum cofactor cytidylyltransferase
VSRIAGVVLAAGLSRRLGRPKQLLQLGDATVIHHVVRRALASSLDEVIVVLGARAADVRAVLMDEPVRFVLNDRYAEGQGTSLAAGIAALDQDVDAAVILLGDQPGIAPELIDRIVQARRLGGASIVMAEYGEERGHPVLFGREHFPALIALEGDLGGRDIIRRHVDDVMVVTAPDHLMPPDIDTEEDWRVIREAWSAG